MKKSELIELIKRKGITVKSVAEASGYTYHGFMKALEADRVRIDAWLLIANVLNEDLGKFVTKEQMQMIEGKGPASSEIEQHYKDLIVHYKTEIDTIRHMMMERDAEYRKQTEINSQLINKLIK